MRHPLASEKIGIPLPANWLQKASSHSVTISPAVKEARLSSSPQRRQVTSKSKTHLCAGGLETDRLNGVSKHGNTAIRYIQDRTKSRPPAHIGRQLTMWFAIANREASRRFANSPCSTRERAPQPRDLRGPRLCPDSDWQSLSGPSCPGRHCR